MKEFKFTQCDSNDEYKYLDTNYKHKNTKISQKLRLKNRH